MVVIAKPLKLKSASKTLPMRQIAKDEARDQMTAAERTHRAVQKQRVLDKVQDGSEPSHRQKVQKFNKRLASYSDHFDLPKTSD